MLQLGIPVLNYNFLPLESIQELNFFSISSKAVTKYEGQKIQSNGGTRKIFGPSYFDPTLTNNFDLTGMFYILFYYAAEK